MDSDPSSGGPEPRWSAETVFGIVVRSVGLLVLVSAVCSLPVAMEGGIRPQLYCLFCGGVGFYLLVAAPRVVSLAYPTGERARRRARPRRSLWGSRRARLSRRRRARRAASD